MLLAQMEIIITKDGTEIARQIVRPGEYIIGRDAGCDVVVDIDQVSRRHARLTAHVEHAVIEDIGSSNGTSVDGRQVTKPTRVWPNQKIQVGLATIEVRRVKGELGDDLTGPPGAAGVHEALPGEFLRGRRYEIGNEVARGGMGAILDARETTTGRTVAMKVMLKPGSHDAVMRFVTEAKVTARLDTDNIVPVHELSVDENNQVFYTMKFVMGVTLREVLKKLCENEPTTLAKYPLAALLTVFQKVCDALAFAHSKGVIHRDLKPENVMIGDYGEVLVMDWGLSKFENESEGHEGLLMDQDSGLNTMVGQVMGTPQYMSPEQARGEIDQLDVRTDIYALGAILYHILALHAPVSGKNAMEVVDKVSRGEVAPLAEASPNLTIRLAHLPGRRVPASLDAVVRKAMAFKRDARYPKVEALQADITAYQNGFATSAENAGAAKLLALFIGRHKAVSLSIVGALVLLACISAAFTTRLLFERNVAIEARTVADDARKQAEQSLGVAETERKRTEEALGTAKSEGKRAEDALGTAESERKRAETERIHADEARDVAEDQRKRAEQALADLKKTAPTFFALAKSLLEEGNFTGAIEKAGYAIQLDAANPDYRLFRANLLEATQDIAGAGQEYDRVLGLRPGDEVAKTNLALCERILAENGKAPNLRKELQKQLLIALREQKRLIEAGPLSVIVEPDAAVAEATIRARLREYRKQPGWDDSRLSRNIDGTFKIIFDNLATGDLSVLKGQAISDLSFSYSDISNLSSLAGLPLKHLVLNYSKVSDLSPLHGMPLESLDLIGVPVADLSPLAGMKLQHLTLSRTEVSDLHPLTGMPLRYVAANNTRIADLTPLRGMPLAYLNLSATHITDLAPLAGAPLDDLDVSYNQISDLKPLAACPKLQKLFLSHTGVSDLAPLAELQLSEIDFSDTSVTYLDPLRKQPLKEIKMDKTFVTNFHPLGGCHTLNEIVISADARNLEPLRALSLLHFISTGETGNGPAQTAAEFWKKYDANRTGVKANAQ